MFDTCNITVEEMRLDHTAKVLQQMHVVEVRSVCCLLAPWGTAGSFHYYLQLLLLPPSLVLLLLLLLLLLLVPLLLLASPLFLLLLLLLSQAGNAAARQLGLTPQAQVLPVERE